MSCQKILYSQFVGETTVKDDKNENLEELCKFLKISSIKTNKTKADKIKTKTLETGNNRVYVMGVV